MPSNEPLNPKISQHTTNGEGEMSDDDLESVVGGGGGPPVLDSSGPVLSITPTDPSDDIPSPFV